jgi:hypothetical protein
MSEFDKNMSKILNTEYIPEAPVENKPLVVVQPEQPEKETAVDADFSRSTYYRLIDQGTLAIDGILEVAKESQHPRAYEVAATLIKNMSEVTEKLMVLQKQKKELTGETAASNITVEKAVFVGSTSDLLKKVKHESSE